MVTLIRVNRIQLVEDSFDIDALRQGPCFLSRPAPELAGLLSEKGITAEVAPTEGVPDGATLLLVEGPLYDLVYVSDRLLGPGGCPWDQAQTHESLKRYLLEESYELFEAIDEDSNEKLVEELGDVLLQPLMHAAMKDLKEQFDIDDVANAIIDKLVRRHPHVFGDLNVTGSEEVLRNWDDIKKKEKGNIPRSLLDGVPKGSASLLRAYDVSKRVERVGFEWPGLEAVFEKLHEEEAELKEAIRRGIAAEVESEVGDLLFTAVNIARWANVEPEEALRKMLNRFTERFMAMERDSTKPLNELTLEEWDVLWERAKAYR